MNNFIHLAEVLKEAMDSSIGRIKDSIDLPKVAQTIIEAFKPYQEISDILRKNIDSYLPALQRIGEVSSTYKAVDKLGDNQYVLRLLLPYDLVEEVNSSILLERIDAAIEKFLEDEGNVQKTVDFIKEKISSNRVFEQALSAYRREDYDLAIIGYTAVLDRLLSECSEQIKNVHIAPRVKAIVKKFEDKGDFFLDDLEARDYALYLTYQKALESFGADSSFIEEEPELPNRHWIMHGRTNREYQRLDCIKVLNMIYGTIRMTELGEEDQSKRMKRIFAVTEPIGKGVITSKEMKACPLQRTRVNLFLMH